MANTPNIDLVKPAGTDHALVSVLNSNSDKIDTFAGTTNQAITKLKDAYNLGSFSTLAALETAINTFFIDSMSDGEERRVYFAVTTAFGLFNVSLMYAGILMRYNSVRCHADFYCDEFTEGNIIGNRYQNNWTWQKLALKSELEQQIKTNGTTSIVVVTNATVSFTNGEGETDLSSLIPSGYRVSIPVGCPENTGSLTVSGCYRKPNSDTVVHIRLANQSYTGSVAINIFTSCIKT